MSKASILNEKGDYACNNGKNNSDCEIYASIIRMSSDDKWKNYGKTENWGTKLVQEGWYSKGYSMEQ